MQAAALFDQIRSIWLMVLKSYAVIKLWRHVNYNATCYTDYETIYKLIPFHAENILVNLIICCVKYVAAANHKMRKDLVQSTIISLSIYIVIDTTIALARVLIV